ncbi:MAG: DJ-1/PfpI family protein [Rhodospirillales bacterium]|jgi:cyclohexyl-isocyanide hydratase
MKAQGDRIDVGFLLYPRLTQLDLTGPYEVLRRLPDVRTHMIWKDMLPIPDPAGLAILPTTTTADVARLDVVVVPGGPGWRDLVEDEEALEWLARIAGTASWITAVSTGSLVLGAAGLLRGYRATSHWMSVDLLAAFGAVPTPERVVVDRDRITGGGVTAGIDFALTLARLLRGADVAEAIQLQMEYDPAPPFVSGTPEQARPEVLEAVLGRASADRDLAAAAVRRAADALAARAVEPAT